MSFNGSDRWFGIAARYVDDKLLLEARDAVLTRGQYGLLTYKTTARYDDFSAVAP